MNILGRTLGTATALAVLLAAAVDARAGLIVFNDRLAFEAQGNVLENYGFEDHSQVDFTHLPNPYEAHGVRYTTTDNLVVCANCGFGNPTNVFTYNFWTPVTGDIVLPGIDMFGFDLGSGGRTDPMDIRIITNQNVYDYIDEAVPNWANGSRFFGFVTDSPGELITGFSIASEDSGAFPGMDNVTLAQQQQVAEPATLAMLGLGLALLGLRRRAR